MPDLNSSDSIAIEERKKSLRGIVKDFCESTSAHGFQYLNFEKDKRFSCLWLCLIFMAIAAFVGTFSLLILRFLSYPTSVEIIESAIPFIFPDVTLCPGLYFHFRKFGLGMNKTTYFFPGSNNASYSDSLNSMSEFWMSVLKMDETKEDINLKLARHSLNPYLPDIEAFQDPQEIIIDCSFRGKKCSYLNFTETWHPERFKCFTFKPENRIIYSASREGGLILVLYSGANSGLYYASELEMADIVDGVYVTIHPENTMPDFSIDDYVVNAGELFEQKLYMYKAMNKNRPTSQCLIKPDLTSYYFNSSTNKDYKHPVYNYTAVDCRNILLQQKYVNQCGCLCPHYYVPFKLRDYPFCYEIPKKYWENGVKKWDHPTDVNYYVDKFNNSTVVEPDAVEKLRCHNRIKFLRLNQDSEDIEMCAHSCNRIYYKTTVERRIWPALPEDAVYYLESKILETTQIAKNNDHDTFINQSYIDSKKDKLGPRQLMMKINLFAGHSDGVLQKEVFIYPIYNLLSDMMGMLGFWTGISVLTICEVIQFLIKLIRRVLDVKTENKYQMNKTNKTAIANINNITLDQNL